jgi:hypothetical protein
MTYSEQARWQAIAVTVVGVLCYILIDYHSPFGQRTWDGVLFYLAIPLATILILRQNPFSWGLGVGHWKWTLGLTLAGAGGTVLLLLVAIRLPALQEYYDSLGPQAGQLWPWIGYFAIDMFAWEFFFRGFFLFGMEPALGELAIYVQIIPFVIAHIGKPELETLSSLVGGILLGYIVRRCRSFWPAFVLHLLLGSVIHSL